MYMLRVRLAFNKHEMTVQHACAKLTGKFLAHGEFVFACTNDC
jgi:hypothetical protein